MPTPLTFCWSTTGLVDSTLEPGIGFFGEKSLKTPRLRLKDYLIKTNCDKILRFFIM
jgi:hypothetical protein